MLLRVSKEDRFPLVPARRNLWIIGLAAVLASVYIIQMLQLEVAVATASLVALFAATIVLAVGFWLWDLRARNKAAQLSRDKEPTLGQPAKTHKSLQAALATRTQKSEIEFA